MDIKITVDVNLSPSTLDALKTIFGGLVSNPVTERQAPVKELASVPSTPLVQKPDNAAGKDEKTEAVTRETVRALAAEKTQAGKKEEVKELVKGYGVKSLPEVPEDKLPELYENLKKIA